MRCPTCDGRGEVDGPTDCDAELAPNGHEVISCWGIAHTGPHAALQCSPCPRCGGFDDHADDCPVIDMDDADRPEYVQAWLQWDDDGTYWFVPGGWHSKQPENIKWRGVNGELR